MSQTIPAPVVPTAPVAAPAPVETKAPAPVVGDLPELGAPPADPNAVPDLGDAPVVEPEDAEAEAADADGEAEDAEKAPIDYQFDAPEGEAPYRAEVVDAYKEVLQKHRVDPDVANDLLATMLPTIQKDLDKQVAEHIDRQKAEWGAQLREQHGEKTADVRRLANAALHHALAAGAIRPEFLNFLRGSALAESPDFNNLLAAFGQRVTNDRPPKSGGPIPAEPRSAMDEAAAQYDREDAKRGG